VVVVLDVDVVVVVQQLFTISWRAAICCFKMHIWVSTFWKATVAESHVLICVQDKLPPLYETLLVGIGAAVQGSHPTDVKMGAVV